MDSLQHFDRLIRMVQETGERMVVSLVPGKDPVVILPLAAYEVLAQKNTTTNSQNMQHARALPLEDVWDSETEYDAERIFAKINAERGGQQSQMPRPVSRQNTSTPPVQSRNNAQEPPAWAPARAGLSGEERFSLGM